MKVKDFLDYDHFYIKQGNDVLGLQINLFGEHHLSDEYGDCLVKEISLESHKEVYNGDPLVLDPDSLCFVLYI